MKKIIFIIIAILAFTAVVVISKGKTMNKGNLMDNTNTYTVIAPNGEEVWFDKNTNLIVSKTKDDNTTKYFKEKSQMLLEARSILDSS
ncbi:thioredoxin reductase, partial [Campylobacter concisus]